MALGGKGGWQKRRLMMMLSRSSLSLSVGFVRDLGNLAKTIMDRLILAVPHSYLRAGPNNIRNHMLFTAPFRHSCLVEIFTASSSTGLDPTPKLPAIPREVKYLLGDRSLS